MSNLYYYNIIYILLEKTLVPFYGSLTNIQCLFLMQVNGLTMELSFWS